MWHDCHLTTVLAEAHELFGGFCTGGFYPEWQYWVDKASEFKRMLERNFKDLRQVCDEIVE